MQQQQTEPTSDPETPDQFEEDRWYFDKTVVELFTVRETTIQYDEDAGYVGEMTIEALDGGLHTYDAATVEEWTGDERVLGVPQRVVLDPRQVVLEYARQKIREDVRVLGKDHEYSGVTGVETVRDLLLALDQLDV